MTTKLETVANMTLKTNVPDVRPGDVVRVHQKVKEGDSSTSSGQAKERTQVFEGVVLAKKHGKGISATITVRKVTQGVGVERIFPLHSPLIDKIEVARRSKTKRAKLYYLREAKGRKARLRAKEFNLEVPEEQIGQKSDFDQNNPEQKSDFSQNTDQETPPEEQTEEKSA